MKSVFQKIQIKKGYNVINLLGLTCALICTILIYLWVNDEVGFDRFHEKKDRLFQVLTKYPESNNEVSKASSVLLAETLQNAVPDIESSVTTAIDAETAVLSVADVSVSASALVASKDFFNLFSFHLVEGDASSVLSNDNSIVISEELAGKLLNRTNNVIGTMITLDNKKQFTVSGMFGKIPRNSTMSFDCVLPIGSMIKGNPSLSAWGQNYFNTYLLLKDKVNVQDVDRKINEAFGKKADARSSLFVRNFSGLYLQGEYENGSQKGGRIVYLRLFAVIGILILVIACINFINLSTARASGINKKTGIQKILGASRRKLVFDFIIEVVAMTLIALALSLLAVAFILPYFNSFTQKEISLSFNTHFILFLSLATLITSFLSGIYPAVYHSGFNPENLIQKTQGRSGKNAGIRKGLIIFQYAVSIVLIAAVMTISRQMTFITRLDPGFEKDHVICFENSEKLAKNPQTFISELKEIPGVINASGMAWNFLNQRASTSGGLKWEGQSSDQNLSFEVEQVNYGFLETLGIKLEEGRTFSEDFPTDHSAIVFNETAIKAMGLAKPIGTKIRVWGMDRQIIGVVKDFHFESVHSAINPLFFILVPSNSKKMVVKIQDGREDMVLAGIGKLWEKFNPSIPFDYKFLDRDYQNQYAGERTIGILSRYFSLIAVIISSLGLLGLAIFTSEQKVKEIGIRKVNGASASEILFLLNRDFIKWVAIAFIVATPVAYYAMNKWLKTFAYKTEMSWWIFALAGMLALGIALLTVSWQSWKAAARNPVEALRYE